MIAAERVSITKAFQRIHQILDKGSFVEIGGHIIARRTDFYTAEGAMASDGVITGYGTIDGRLVYLFSQDGEIMGGSFGEMHGRKLCRLYGLAMRAKAPVIGLVDCSGLRLEEGADSLDAFSSLYKMDAEASHKILQIMVICGKCSGGMAVAAEMADIVFSDCTDLRKRLRSLVDLLPANTMQFPEQLPCDDDLNRICPGMAEKRGDGRAILKELSDNSFFFEIEPDRGRDVATGFLCLNGCTVGGIASQSGVSDSKITAEGFDKTASFVDLCGKVHIPILTVADGRGFDGIREAGRLVKALASISVPKVSLIAGKIFGSIYSIWNTKGIGADYVFMWDCAEAGLIDPQTAAEILYPQAELSTLRKRAEDYRQTYCSPMALARHGCVDKIIKPEESRKYILGAFQTFAGGWEVQPWA